MHTQHRVGQRIPSPHGVVRASALLAPHGNLIVSRELDADRKGHRFRHRAFNDGDFCPRGQGRHISPLEVIGGHHDARTRLGPPQGCSEAAKYQVLIYEFEVVKRSQGYNVCQTSHYVRLNTLAIL